MDENLRRKADQRYIMFYIYPVKKICYYLCLLVIWPDFRIVTATTENMKGFSVQLNNGVQ